MHHERYTYLLFIHRRAVVPAPVLLKLLTMIRTHDNERVGPLLPNSSDNLANSSVSRGNLCVVSLDISIPERILGVRFIRLVRFEEMNPQEQARVGFRGVEIVPHLLRA